MTPMTVAMMMFTALSLIESASIPASLSLRTAEAIQSAAAVSVAPKASPETMDVARLDADDQTPTAVPTTYPTPSRRCYRYADGAATYYAACGEDEPFLVIDGVVAEYRGACVNEDAVDACLAAAQCSAIDENEIGGPATCGDAIAGRVHQV